MASIPTINITPTWAAVLPLLLAGVESGTFEGARIAREELHRMARLADTTTHNWRN